MEECISFLADWDMSSAQDTSQLISLSLASLHMVARDSAAVNKSLIETAQKAIVNIEKHVIALGEMVAAKHCKASISTIVQCLEVLHQAVHGDRELRGNLEGLLLGALCEIKGVEELKHNMVEVECSHRFAFSRVIPNLMLHLYEERRWNGCGLHGGNNTGSVALPCFNKGA